MERYIFEDWDEPFHIPLALLRTDPKRYAELLIKRREAIDKATSLFAPKLKIGDGIIGKVFISSLMSDDEGYAKQLWNETDNEKRTESGLIRFFKPFQ